MPVPAKISDHTLRMVAPDDWDAGKSGHCGTLFVRHETIDGVDYVRSAWEITAEEALFLIAGSKMLLSLAVPVQPVTQLQIDHLPPDFPPAFTVRRLPSRAGVSLIRVEGLYMSPVHGPRKVYIEEPLDPAGLGLTVGRAIDKIEELAQLNGYAR